MCNVYLILKKEMSFLYNYKTFLAHLGALNLSNYPFLRLKSNLLKKSILKNNHLKFGLVNIINTYLKLNAY